MQKESNQPLILIVAKSEQAFQLNALLRPFFQLHTANSEQEALSFYQHNHLKIRLVLLHESLFPKDCTTFLTRLKHYSHLPEYIAISEKNDVSFVVEAIKAGAFDVIVSSLNNLDPVHLRKRIQNALEVDNFIQKMQNSPKKDGFVNQFHTDLKTALQKQVDISEPRGLVSGDKKTILSLMESKPIVTLQDVLNSIINHQFKHYSILIIEDDAAVMLYLETILGPHYILHSANSGEAALAKLDEGHPFDLVLLDIYLPDISGVDLLPQLKARLPKTEVVIMTAFKEADIAIHTLRFGAADYINKPFGKTNLLTTLSNTLQHAFMKRNLQHFQEFCNKHSLSNSEKISQLEQLHALRSKEKKFVLMKDIYDYFPELKQSHFLEETVVPVHIFLQEKGIHQFLENLKLTVSK